MAQMQLLGGERLVNIDDSDAEDEDEGPSYLMIELTSTVAFKEVDIDKMLEHTTLDDFLKGLYLNIPG